MLYSRDFMHLTKRRNWLVLKWRRQSSRVFLMHKCLHFVAFKVKTLCFLMLLMWYLKLRSKCKKTFCFIIVEYLASSNLCFLSVATPMSLQQLSRLTVRKKLGTTALKVIGQLDIPKLIISYLCYQWELDHCSERDWTFTALRFNSRFKG